jgi:hypothetical protein
MLMIFDLAALGSSKSKVTTGYFADSAAPGGAHRGRPERHRGRRRALARMTLTPCRAPVLFGSSLRRVA